MAFPTSDRRKAWTTFLDIVKSNQVLKREVKTFRSWTGGNRKEQSGPNTKDMPFLRLQAQPDESVWIDTAVIQSDFLVDVEIAMMGEDPSLLMDFWSSIERSIYPLDSEQYGIVWTRLHSVGIQSIDFSQGAWGLDEEEEQGGQILHGTGQIRIGVQLQMKDY